jgi:hypothetical protein
LLSKNIKIEISRIIILPVVLYGCETGPPTFRDEHRMSVFESTCRMRRKSFFLKREEGVGEWKILHNEKLHDLYSSPNIVRAIKSRIIGWAGNVTCMVQGSGGHRILVGKSEGRRSLERPRCRWITLKLIFKTLVGVMECIDLAQFRGRRETCECGNEPSVSIKRVRFLD